VRDYPPHAGKEGVLANQRLEMKLASSATVNIVASMRIAVLADIHGNLLALEAVIRDLHTNTPDLVVNLGDHLSGPLWAAATADLLISETDWVHIRGNHDRQLVELQTDAMGQSDRAAAAQLSMSQKSWLASLPSRRASSDCAADFWLSARQSPIAFASLLWKISVRARLIQLNITGLYGGNILLERRRVEFEMSLVAQP
jgi:Calcineurin-like phosphoesterase